MAKQASDITVLVVEDDSAARTMYRMFLTHEGYTVHTAADGGVAIDQAHRWTPDVIIMDLTMPGTTLQDHANRSRPLTIPGRALQKRRGP